MPLTLISRLFDPLNVFGVIALVAIVRNFFNTPLLVPSLLIFIFGMLLPPFIVLAWAIRTHRISNWDVSNRKQRINVLTGFIPFLIIDLLVVWIFGNVQLLSLFLVFALWFIGFLSITMVWKISGHTSAGALAAGLLIRWFEWSVWPVIGIIPILIVVRVVRHDHTMIQAIAGVIYSSIIIVLALILGFI